MLNLRKISFGLVLMGMFFVRTQVFATDTVSTNVRITQPSYKESIQTFDSQMNIMGEATKDTKITVIVYYGDEVDVLTEDTVKDVYELKPVGATKAFSQLINLKEGRNNIIIKYIYELGDEKGQIKMTIIRRAQAEKQLMRSYVAQQTLLNKITTSEETQSDGASKSLLNK